MVLASTVYCGSEISLLCVSVELWDWFVVDILIVELREGGWTRYRDLSIEIDERVPKQWDA